MTRHRIVLAALVAGLALASQAEAVPPTHPLARPIAVASDRPATALFAAAPVALRSAARPSLAQRVFARMTERERIGQVLMVGCPSSGVSSSTARALRRNHVGSVIIDGTTNRGVQAIARLSARLQRLAPGPANLYVASDQEGGYVQRLQGAGFSRIPTALQQGTVAATTLRSRARQWGGQLHAAGVNLNLAPVLDTVPAGFGSNPPIGNLDREYGHTTRRVRIKGLAVAQGLHAAGVSATVKHFPGLGRVHGNTDTSSGVRDRVTTRHDAYLAPFRAAAQAHVPFVMMSTAIYTRIDARQPAAFSATIVHGMLRRELHFRGLVISDDLGAAAQVSGYSVGARAVRFVAAGGNIVLTVSAAQAATMTAAILARLSNRPAFRHKVDAAALRVLQAKQAAGLLG